MCVCARVVEVCRCVGECRLVQVGVYVWMYVMFLCVGVYVSINVNEYAHRYMHWNINVHTIEMH